MWWSLDCPDMTVGLGSRPDRDGRVTLDAAVMQGDGRAGCVAFVQGVAHPISLARLVMERTPHVLLVGEGAEQFARECGINVAAPKLTPAAEQQWRAWLAERKYAPKINIENHDTISMLALDAQGSMAAGSTTSGLAYKMHGRVGDSPIIGAGIFVDAPIGGAICTGLGETVLRTLGALLAVEAMRAGATPQEACEHAIARIIAKNPNPENYQVGMLTLDFSGHTGIRCAKGLQLRVAGRTARSAFAIPLIRTRNRNLSAGVGLTRRHHTSPPHASLERNSMFFAKSTTRRLAEAAYLIGCQRTGEAIVIDPERDIDRYEKVASANGLRIVAAADTHIHADFLSGLREFAEKGARIYVSDEGDADWKYEWLHKKSTGGNYDAALLKHGSTFKVGNIHFRAIHTPGTRLSTCATRSLMSAAVRANRWASPLATSSSSVISGGRISSRALRASWETPILRRIACSSR